MRRLLAHVDSWRESTVLRWGAGPVVAALLVGALLRVVPVSGPVVYFEWRPTVDAHSRTSLERKHKLSARHHVSGTLWGYTLADTSNANLASLLTLPEALSRQGVEADPLRATGRQVVHLVGPFSVQSLIGLLVGFLLIVGAGAPTARIRQVYFLAAAAAMAASCWAAALPLRASHEVGTWMGDYDTYSMDREHFDEYFGYGAGNGAVRFHYHLGGFVLKLIDRALGSTGTSFQTALQILPGLMAVVALLEAALVAALSGWSAQSMRYVALCTAAPLTLMFFGYRELGYMSLSVAAMPLYLMTVDRSDDSRNRTLIRGAASLQGLHAALHGLGLSGVASLVAMALASARGLKQAVSRAGTVFMWAFVAYAIWLLVYLMPLGLPIVPGHASGIAFRGLVESYVSEKRLVEPLLSFRGMRDVGAEAFVVGLPVVLIGIWAARGESRRAILAAAIVSVAILLLIWPAQGIGQDTDLVLATFPAFFAGAWLCAARHRAALAALCTLAVGHAVFWLVVRSEAFTNPGI